MKTYDEFLNRLQQAYDKEYNQVQADDIIEYLEKRNFPISALDNLYDLITSEETYLPKKNKFKDIVDKSLKSGTLSINSGLNPESPLQQLYKHKDKSAEKIISGCKWIRGQQNIRPLKSYEISYLAIWERLRDVQDDFINIAKDRIVANGDKELYSGTQIDLSDLLKPMKPIENIKKLVSKVIPEIPF
jgi:hypothetical protein